MSKKKLLTLDDLYTFYLNQNKTCKFNSKKSGYQLSVQVPAQFEINKEMSDDSLLFCKVKLMHSGENRNHSSVTEDALKNCSKTLAYKPILANFVEYEDENGNILKDFTSHDMEFNEDGTVTYLEKQVGCFTSDEPFFEVEEDTGHNFLYGYCAIPREYTDACSIIERKNGTKISVELAVNEMAYNNTQKVLELTDVIIMGATLLGKDKNTLNDVGEGMLNARLDIADFSLDNNSIIKYAEKLDSLTEKVNTLISRFNDIENQNSKEGGNDSQMNKFEELLKQYNKTVEDIDFEYESMSDEELEAKFTELFGEEDAATDDNNVVSDDNADNSDDDTNGITDGENSDDDNPSGDDVNTNNSDNAKDYSLTVKYADKEFSISLQEKIYALSDLVNAQYAEADNTWYSVTAYEDHVIMCDWWSGKYFKQTYSEENEIFTLTGDRIQVFAEFVTQDELDSLNAMRSNYASLVEFKATVEKNELHTKREEILNSEKYSSISETEAFKKLYSEMDNYSLEELEKEAKIIFADNFNMETFAAHTEKTQKKSTVKVFANVNKSKKDSRYGNLFSK